MNDKLTTIHLVRHGEVDNPSEQLYGRQPGSHLTLLGHAIAESATDFFDERDLWLIVSSSLERARETVEPTAQRHGLLIVFDEGLTEAGNKFEGVDINRNRLILAHPRYWPWYVNPTEPSWGEPYTETVVRLSGTVRRALHEAGGDEAMLVSHQLPIWTIRHFVEGRPLTHDPHKRECILCSVISLMFVGRQLVGVGYDEPAAELIRRAHDVTPGASRAAIRTGL